MGQEAMILIGSGVILIIFTIIFLIFSARQIKKSSEDTTVGKVEVAKKDSQVAKVTPPKDVPKSDMSNFINFDKISDNMIVQNGAKKYTMVIQCKGINYDLMSEVEQMAVEEGFITFLNTLKQPIQLYVQTRTIDLDENVKMYKEKVNDLSAKRQDLTIKYNSLENDIDSDKEERARVKYEKDRLTNIHEYAMDITRYVEKISLNQTMLQRKFYILVSYYKTELVTTEHFTAREYQDLCYRELYTRVQGIIGALQACSVECKILNSNQIAEFLYIAYNRDDEKIIDVKKALESGFYRLYSTSDDVRVKKQEMLDQQIKEEGLKRVEAAIKEAIDQGLIVDEKTMQENVDKEIDRTAIKIIDNSEIDRNLKNILKDNILKNRKARIDKKHEEEEELIKVNAQNEEDNIIEKAKKDIEDELDKSTTNDDSSETKVDTTDELINE